MSSLTLKTEKPFSLGSSPHLHSRDTAAKRMWSIFLALFPVFLASVILFGWPALRALALSTGSAVAFGWVCEWMRQRIFLPPLWGRKKVGGMSDSPPSSPSPARGEGNIMEGALFAANVLTGLVIAVMLPIAAPWWMILLGTFFAVVLARECFGGLGQAIFHPAAVGYLGLTLLFPDRPFWEHALSGSLNLSALWASGLILLGMRRIPWQIPLLYLLTLAACHFWAGTFLIPRALPAAAWFAAFFLVSDPETTPITKDGKAIFAVCAALLTGFGAGRTHFLEAGAAAILLMNGAAPLIDRWVKPAR